jgi:hypothetical protein
MNKMENSKQTAFGYGFTTADGSSHVEEKGLTKREYFAAMAMQGIIGKINVHEYKDMAEYAVNAADALLAKLSNEEGQ